MRCPLENAQRSAPQLLRYLLSTWTEGGLRLWRRGPSGWTQRTATTGIPQGSPLSPELIGMVLAHAMAGDLPPEEADPVGPRVLQARHLEYVDDITL